MMLNIWLSFSCSVWAVLATGPPSWTPTCILEITNNVILHNRRRVCRTTAPHRGGVMKVTLYSCRNKCFFFIIAVSNCLVLQYRNLILQALLDTSSATVTDPGWWRGVWHKPAIRFCQHNVTFILQPTVHLVPNQTGWPDLPKSNDSLLSMSHSLTFCNSLLGDVDCGVSGRALLMCLITLNLQEDEITCHILLFIHVIF